MNIPTEHFTATPVYALSPCQEGGGQTAPPSTPGQRAPLFKLGVPSVPGKTGFEEKNLVRPLRSGHYSPPPPPTDSCHFFVMFSCCEKSLIFLVVQGVMPTLLLVGQFFFFSEIRLKLKRFELLCISNSCKVELNEI